MRMSPPNHVYIPKPIDLSGTELPESVVPLVDVLAKNAHEVWAKQRMDQGWVYGPERNDGRKEHPCLVLYEDLPESEKDVDRQAVITTLKAILALGCQIQCDLE
jgi:ryanodine receptor 2